MKMLKKPKSDSIRTTQKSKIRKSLKDIDGNKISKSKIYSALL